MKTIYITFLTACLTYFGHAQNEIKFIKTIEIDNKFSIPFERIDLDSRPDSPDFFIVDDDFVNKISTAIRVFNEFEYYQNTLYILPNSDSVIVSEGENNSYLIMRQLGEWQVINFTFKGTNITLRHIVCGQTSSEVFSLLNKKRKVPLGDGQVWVSDKENKRHFVFTFSKDKLVSIQY